MKTATWITKHRAWLKSLYLEPTKASAEHWGIPDKAVPTLRTFLKTGDGSALAVWTHDGTEQIVLLGSEGQNEWLAPSLSVLEANFRAKKSGLYDVDGDRAKPPSKAKSKAFQKFLDGSVEKPAATLATAVQPLYKLLRPLAKKRNRANKLYWQQEFLVTASAKGLSIDWYDYGRKPCPVTAAAKAAFASVVPLLKKKPEHRFTVDADGNLYINGQTVIQAP